MARAIKKRIEVEVFQMTREKRWNSADWPEWLNEAWNYGTRGAPGSVYTKLPVIGETKPDDNRLLIATLEGELTIDWGDWIIQGVVGEIYPCKPEIFEATYDLVQEDGGDPVFDVDDIPKRQTKRPFEQEFLYDVRGNTTHPKYIYVVTVGNAGGGVGKFMFGVGELPECFVDRTLAMKAAKECVPAGTRLDRTAMDQAVYIEAAWTYGGTTTWVERLEVTR